VTTTTAPTFTPTDEQVACLDAFDTGAPVSITARAGTGKTSTLRLLAGSRPSDRVLYVAYNKAIQTDAEKSFPPNVEARTAHSLAYREFGVPMRDRLNAPRRNARQIAQLLDVQPAEIGRHKDGKPIVLPAAALVDAARTVLRRFTQSADERITSAHVAGEGLPLCPPGGNPAAMAAAIVEVAQRLWADATSPRGILRAEHDVYLKLWQLSHPVLRFDAVLLDEAQDANPVIADVILSQIGSSQVVLVGDPCQSIYGWNGAIDVLDKVPGAVEATLTQSFRFGEAVAEEANCWLARMGASPGITGNPAKTSTVGDDGPSPDAVLTRTNGGAVAVVLQAQQAGRSVALVGGGGAIVSFAGAAEDLIAGHGTSYSELSAFRDFTELKEFSETPAGSDLKVMVGLVDKYGPRALISAARALVNEDRADVTVSTAHRSKGREWPVVRVHTDFPRPRREGGRTVVPGDEEMRLAYVAVTRGEDHLDPSGVSWIHEPREFDDYLDDEEDPF